MPKLIEELRVFQDQAFQKIAIIEEITEFLLSGNIETNTRPPVVDHCKTIVAPYSEGNIAIFVHNAHRLEAPSVIGPSVW